MRQVEELEGEQAKIFMQVQALYDQDEVARLAA